VTLHTSLGDIKMELYCDRAPKSCENFLALAASNYYDNTVFHRNIKGAAPRSNPPVHGHILRNDALTRSLRWDPAPGRPSLAPTSATLTDRLRRFHAARRRPNWDGKRR